MTTPFDISKSSYPLIFNQAIELPEKMDVECEDIFKQLFQKGVEWISNNPTVTGKTLSIVTSKNCDGKYALEFLKMVEAANFKNSKDIGKLIRQSIKVGNEEMAVKLLKIFQNHSEFDVDAKDSLNRSILCLAITNNMDRLAYDLLLERASVKKLHKAPDLEQNHFAQNGIIHRLLQKAIVNRNEYLALKLLKQLHEKDHQGFSFDINLENSSGETLLELAYRFKLKKVISQLVFFRAEINPLNRDGHPIWQNADLNSGGFVHELIIHCMKKGQQVRVMRLLEAHGINQTLDLNAKDHKNRTLLHLCSKYHCMTVWRHLVEKEVDLDIEDVYGLTAADYAELFNHSGSLGQIYKKGVISQLTENSWLAHVWSIEREREFGKMKFEYGGFNAIEASQRTSKSAQNFLKDPIVQKKIEHHPELKKINLESVFNSLETLSKNKTPLEIISDFKAGKPQFIQCNWGFHYTAVLLGRNNRVMKCNQGDGWEEEESGIKIFEMHDLTALLNVICKLQEKETVKSYFISEMDNELQLTQIDEIKQTAQEAPNCTYASNQSAIFALFFDQGIQDFGGDRDLALECAELLYKDWAFYARIEALEHYLKISKKPDMELLDLIVEKAIDLEDRKERWEDQSEIVIDLIRKYIPSYKGPQPELKKRRRE